MKSSASSHVFWLVKSAVMAVVCMLLLVGLSTSLAAANLYSASGTYSYTAGTLVMTWANSDFICDGPEFPAETDTVTSLTATQMIWQSSLTDSMTWNRSSGTAGDITGTWTATDMTTGSTYTLAFAGTATSGTISVTGAISSCGADGPPTISSFSPASGMAGNLITINGSNFSPILANNVVMFNGVAAIVTGAQYGHLFALVPAGATTGTISVTNSGLTATSSAAFTVYAGTPVATLNWGGVIHRVDSDGVEFVSLDAGIGSYADTLDGMTLSVAGPNGFAYTFSNTDVYKFMNGQLAAFRNSTTAPAFTLASGVYTFTLNDGQGHISHRVDTHTAALPRLSQVDSATIQMLRKPDGSYRISWAPLNDTQTYYYRARIARNDAAGTKYVYDSARDMASFADVPAGILFDNSMYKIRIEAGDSPNGDLATNRSDSAWKLFGPEPSDYDANRLIFQYLNVNNRIDSDGTKKVNYGFGVCTTNSACNGANAATTGSAFATEITNGTATAVLTGPAGFSHTFTPAELIQPNNTDFYITVPTANAPPGTYKFHIVNSGVATDGYATLTTAVDYPIPNPATYQAEDLGNGNIRFSWADADYTGALYYRVQVQDNVTKQYFTSARLNQTYADMPKTTLGDLTNKMWRVEVYDSTSSNTQRNRVNGPWTAVGSLASLPPYDPTKPVINGYKVRNFNLPGGTSATHLFIMASDFNGTITERRVDGPIGSGFSRILRTPDAYTQGAYSLAEPGSPAVGLYKITAVDNDSNSVVRYNYQPAPKVIPPVDYHTFQVDREPNGDLRISWAPIVSDVPLWYSLEMYDANTLSPVIIPSNYTAGSVMQLVSVTVPAAYLPGKMMFRIVAFDGSNSTTYNNASRSVMVGYQPGVIYAGLVDADNDGYASNVDPADVNAVIDPFWSTAASGTYTYPGGASGTLTWTFDNSNFVCDGPKLGTESIAVTGLTATSMTLTDTNGDMTWTRPSGTAGDISGAWNISDPDTGSSYNVTFNNGVVSVIATVVKCGANGPPTITSFVPSTGVTGNLITINGSNFSPIATNNAVTFNGVPAVVTGVRPNQLFAVVPPGATTGTIRVTNLGGTAFSSTPFTVSAGSAAVILNSGGVSHRLDSDGTDFDAFDALIGSYATTLTGMSLSVAGPGNFVYTFSDADVIQYVNGQIVVYKKYPTGTLAEGVYTYTLVDGQGTVSHRVDTHVVVAGPLPLVDSATIQMLRKVDGSYRISWAPVNATKTYYYRVRINRNDAAGTYIYDSARTMTSFADVPPGILFDDSMYKVRVETVDSPNGDLATCSSRSAWKLFSPQMADYDANRYIFQYLSANHRTDSDGSKKVNFGFAVCSTTGVCDNTNAAVAGSTLATAITNGTATAVLTGPAGFSHTFTQAELLQPNSIDFYITVPTANAPVGTYNLHIVNNGISYDGFAALTTVVDYPMPNPATYQAEDLGNGNIRFSWSNVGYSGALYYRVSVNDNVTSQYITSPRINQTFADMSKASLGDLTNKTWRVEVYDSTSSNTQRNRVNGPSTAVGSLASLPAYDLVKPVIDYYFLYSMNLLDVSTAALYLLGAHDSDGNITQRRVDGPNGFTRNLSTPDPSFQNAFSLIETGSPAAGLYTLTAEDGTGKNSVRYKYQSTPHDVPAVDYHTFQVDLEPNGAPRISWAPVVSDVPIWYYLELWNLDTMTPVVIPAGNAASTNMQQTSVTIPSQYLQGLVMFRIFASDGSDYSTINNSGVSAEVRYQPGVNYAGLTDADHDGYASNIDPNDNDPNTPIQISHTLALTFAGTGSGSVNSTPSGIACTGNSCPPAAFTSGTVVTLSAVAGAGSLFSGWPVPPCTVNVNGNCEVTMSEARNITTTFNVMQLARITGTGTYYGLLAHAYTAAVSADTIEARDGTFVENLILNRPVSVVFKGGYNAGFASSSGGFTYLDGKLTITAGRLSVQGLKIK